MQAKLDSLISELKTKLPDKLIKFAYELIYNQNIFQNFDLNVNKPLTDEQTNAYFAKISV